MTLFDVMIVCLFQWVVIIKERMRASGRGLIILVALLFVVVLLLGLSIARCGLADDMMLLTR